MSDVDQTMLIEAARRQTEGLDRRTADLDRRAMEAAKDRADLVKRQAEVAQRLANFDRQVREEAATIAARQTLSLNQRITALEKHVRFQAEDIIALGAMVGRRCPNCQKA